MPEQGDYSLAPYPLAPEAYGFNQSTPPVTYQPGQEGSGPYSEQYGAPPGGMTPAPFSAVGVAPGLEYLLQVDQVLVHHIMEVGRTFLGARVNSQYEIKNSSGQKVFQAIEMSDECSKTCCYALRPLEITIKDNNDREVIRLIRPLQCNSCWCPCCLQEMEVQAPPGTTVGYVQQDWHPFKPKFSIQGPNKETVMKITGPNFFCNCSWDFNFELTGRDGETPIGRITKGLFTDFGIHFPLDMDMKMKVVLIGACFLIDFNFFGMPRQFTQQTGQ